MNWLKSTGVLLWYDPDHDQWSEFTRITDHNPDYPKGTHPPGDWDRIYSNQKEVKYVSAFNFRADVEAPPPQLHILFFSPPPFHP